jgi:hypothetical protein
MAKDRIRPLKLEDPATGGTELDQFPVEVNPNEDYPDVRGITFQDDSSNDEDVFTERDASGNLTFKDKMVGAVQTLSDLVAGTGGLTIEGHKILRQLIHFLDDGPGEGFPSGCFREVTGPLVFPTGITWYEDATKAKKIVERTLTWTGPVVTTDEWKVYDTDGSTVLATVTDTITYVGVFEDERTRAIA